MSAATVLSQLKGLLEKTKQLKERFSKTYPTDGQWDALTGLSLELTEAAKEVQNEVLELKKLRSERAWKESEEHRLKAQLCAGQLFAKGRLRQPVVFRRNIVTIFEGPKDSQFDSEDTKFRKTSTRDRCKAIRRLAPDGLISWAIAFPPTVWAGGSMASDVFTCLLDNIEPEMVQTWPPVIRETLDMLMEDEDALRTSIEYREFLQALDDPSRRPVQRKRRRIEYGSGENKTVTDDSSTSRENTTPSSRDELEIYRRQDPMKIYGLLESTSQAIPTGAQPFNHAQDDRGKNNFTGMVTQNKVSMTREQQGLLLRSPSTENREFKDMYTNAPVSKISTLPKQIRTAIENSALWKWERSQGLQVTGCLATLFPKSNQQDVSFTIWCGNEDGYDIIKTFGLQLDISS